LGGSEVAALLADDSAEAATGGLGDKSAARRFEELPGDLMGEETAVDLRGDLEAFFGVPRSGL